MQANPYASYLGEQDAASVLAATPDLIHQAVCALTPEQIAAPLAPGKWSPCQVVAHMADCELAFSFRLRQILAAPAEEQAQLQPFDQDAWARNYAAYDLPSALDLFRAARAWNLKLVAVLSPPDLQRTGFHPERGEQTFQLVLEMMAGHDLNHLRQLQQLA